MGMRPAAGGGRWLEVSPERVEGWLGGFDAAHGVLRSRYSAGAVTFEAADGALAECWPAFPLRDLPGSEPGGWDGGGWDGLVAGPLVAHALARRRVGVVLARLGGYAVGIFDGDRLAASKVGSRPVHGRSAAGGWSQQRFARRREGQVAQAARAAADDVARVLAPSLARGKVDSVAPGAVVPGGVAPGGVVLDGVVLGGDRRAVDALRPDPRLAGVFAAAVDRFLTTPDPKLAVLREAPRQFRAIRVRLVQP
ncbi:MAG TPA: acVLRF1 family peptidyl-tRNA hydrolase [Mycobacteriales bacterium]|nr:acVLRF1 family peptidyl-tRNA hydrolase [Mycobacteriales bacterium]